MENNFEIRYKFWLESPEGEGILGDGKWELLKMIHDEGSLMAAVEKKGYSYRKTWNKLKEIEKKLGYHIIEKTRGGASGGSTVLTEDGKKLVNAFSELHQNLDKAFFSAIAKFRESVK